MDSSFSPVCVALVSITNLATACTSFDCCVLSKCYSSCICIKATPACEKRRYDLCTEQYHQFSKSLNIFQSLKVNTCHVLFPMVHHKYKNISVISYDIHFVSFTMQSEEHTEQLEYQHPHYSDAQPDHHLSNTRLLIDACCFHL